MVLFENFRDFLAVAFPNRGAVLAFLGVPPLSVAEADFPVQGTTRELWHQLLALIENKGLYEQFVAELIIKFPQYSASIQSLAPRWRGTPLASPPTRNLANPYPGLRPYKTNESDYFFGREKAIAEVLWLLKSNPLLTVFGGSGSGKSSLFRAGIIPRWQKEGGEAILLTPGSDPFASLLSMGLENNAQAETLIESARQGERFTLIPELQAKLYSGRRLLVIVDQGEQLFTRSAATAREFFLKCLFFGERAEVRILVGLRDDYYPNWSAAVEKPDQQTYNLRAPSLDDWRDMILKPARKHEVFFEAGLPDEMLEKLTRNQATLPLLQFLLRRLWEHDQPADGILNWDSYRALGGVEGALSQQIDKLFGEFPERKKALQQLILRLVRFDRQEGQYRAVATPCAKEQLPSDLLDKLMADEYRLVTTRAQDGAVELAHEVILRAWPGFEKLEREHGEILAIGNQLREDSRRWKQTEDAQKKPGELWSGTRLERASKLAGMLGETREPDRFAMAGQRLEESEKGFLAESLAEKQRRDGAEKRRRKQRQVFVGSLSLITSVAVASAGYAFSKQQEASREKAVAQSAKGTAEQLINAMLFDLRDKLKPLGKLDLLDLVSKKAERYFEQQSGSGGQSAGFERNRSVMLHNRGNVLVAMGDLKAARPAFEQALAIDQRRLEGDPANAAAQRDLSVSYERLGELEKTEGRLKAARAAFEQSKAIRERLAKADPTNIDAQRDLAASDERLGYVATAEGDLKTARTAFKQVRIIVERLANADPTNVAAQRDLSVNYNHLGDLAKTDGDLKEARQDFEQGRAIAERLVKADPTNATALRDLAVSYNKLGDLSVIEADLKAARQVYEQALAIVERLAKADPTNAFAQHDLSVSYERLGDLATAERDLKAARVAFEQAKAIRERLAKADPTNVPALLDLAVSYERLGELGQIDGDLKAALAAFQKEREIGLLLTMITPDQPSAVSILGYASIRVVEILQLTVPETPKITLKTILAQGADPLKKLRDANRLPPQNRVYLDRLEANLKKLE